MVRKDSQITDRKEITEKKVGVVEGTSSAQYAEDYLSEDNKITYYKNITKVWNDLEKGTIDATIYDTTGIQNYMQEHADNTNLSVLNEQLNSEESNYGIMFVKGYKYLDQFNVKYFRFSIMMDVSESLRSSDQDKRIKDKKMAGTICKMKSSCHFVC